MDSWIVISEILKLNDQPTGGSALRIRDPPHRSKLEEINLPLIDHTLVLGAMAAVAAWGQQKSSTFGRHGEDFRPRVGDHETDLSAIVVGTRGTLVVDTGLGPRNGATIARVAAKLSVPNARLYLTTTHFHPEHAAGDAGFPPGTILIRNAVQQQEMDARQGLPRDVQQPERPVERTSADVNLRTPDVIYNDDAKVDLGGASVRLLWFGGAHTKGDELIFVRRPHADLRRRVVQEQSMRAEHCGGWRPAGELARGAGYKIAALNALRINYDHSAPGDGSLVAQKKAFMTDIRTRAGMKKQGVSADEAGKQLSTDLKANVAGL